MAGNKPGLQPLIEVSEDAYLAIADLAKLTEDDIPKVPEAIFVQHVLPVMANRNSGQKVDLGKWLDVAGHAQRPIDVVDQSGVVLFRVPALMRSLDSTTAATNARSWFESLATAQKKMQILPALGKAHLDNAFKRSGLVSNKVDMNSASAWNNILKRYGYPPLYGEAEVPNPKDAPAQLGKETGSILSDVDDDL